MVALPNVSDEADIKRRSEIFGNIPPYFGYFFNRNHDLDVGNVEVSNGRKSSS